jgi:hypothetical protein
MPTMSQASRRLRPSTRIASQRNVLPHIKKDPGPKTGRGFSRRERYIRSRTAISYRHEQRRCQTADRRAAGSSARPVSALACWTRDNAPAKLSGHHKAALAPLQPRLGGNVMPDFSAFTAIASSLNAAVNITKAMKDLNDWSVFQSKVIELQSAILEAQSGVFEANTERSALIEQIGQLKKEMADLKTWETEKNRYELKDISGGALAYALKPEAHGTEPPHYICANCYEHDKKSLLQIKAKNTASMALGIPTQYRCPECRSEIPA